jgi:hypothetical protein
MRLSDLKSSYPEFHEIYRSHFQAAKFDTILRRDTDFGDRKLRLVSVQHLLEKHPRLRPERRTQLVQHLLRGDFDNAHLILQAQGSKRFSSVFNLVTSPLSVFLPSPSDVGSLKREMKSLAARISDSQFLLDMKDVDDEVLRPMGLEIEILSQHEVSRRNLQHEIESGERRLQSEALLELIRKLNILSAGRRDWYVVFNLS